MLCAPPGCCRACWAFLAPGVPYKVLADGRLRAAADHVQHHFVGLALFCWLGVIVGVTMAVGAWAWRSTRGLAMLLSLGLATWSVRSSRTCSDRCSPAGVDPVTVGASNAITVVSAPPATEPRPVAGDPAGLALAIYTILVAWSGLPDLGRSDSAIPDGLAAPPMS